MRSWRGGHEGQSVVELALFMPLLAFFLVGALQYGLLFLADLALTNVGRDGTRWLSVHPDTTDASFSSMIATRLPSAVTSSGLAIAVTPPCPTLTGGSCDTRPTGTTLAITYTYDVSALVIASFIPIPTTQLRYTMYARAEPR